jgi:hypothetical protein
MEQQLIDVKTRRKVSAGGAIDIATCGACGRSWDDGRITSITPTPAGRCPFEDLHGFETMADVRERNEEVGSYWFSTDTMRFFRTRILGVLVAGRYFVTSERGPDGIRRYSVREALPDGSIETVGDFGEWSTAGKAHTRAAQLGTASA